MVRGCGDLYEYFHPVAIYLDHPDIRADVCVELSVLQAVRPGKRSRRVIFFILEYQIFSLCNARKHALSSWIRKSPKRLAFSNFPNTRISLRLSLQPRVARVKFESRSNRVSQRAGISPLTVSKYHFAPKFIE